MEGMPIAPGSNKSEEVINDTVEVKDSNQEKIKELENTIKKLEELIFNEQKRIDWMDHTLGKNSSTKWSKSMLEANDEAMRVGRQILIVYETNLSETKSNLEKCKVKTNN